MKETDCNFLRRQAELCIALSRSTFDLTLAARLRALAEELKSKAAQGSDDDLAAPAYGGNGTRLHPAGRN